MKIIYQIFFAFVIFSLFPVVAFAEPEEILSYHTKIKIEPSSQLIVKETIVVRANNDQIKRGIYRDFPTIYYDDKGRKVKTGFDVISVKRNGRPEQWKKTRISNGERLYIGSPKVSISPGTYSYEIEFKTDNQLGYFDDHDELYFNVIGTGWVFPILSGSAEIELPREIDQNQITTYGYTGFQSSKGANYRAAVLDGKRVYFETTRRLQPYEGFTIVVGWPKGLVKKPIDVELIGYGVGALISLILLIYYFISWYLVGQDPEKGTIIPLYKAPKELSPAAVRYISKMAYDNKCLSTTIISLATKGYLQITEKESGIFKTRRHSLVKSTNGSAELNDSEQLVLGELFATSDSVELDDLNYRIFQELNKKLLSTLTGAYKGELFHLNRAHLVFPLITFFITIGCCIATQTFFSVAIMMVLIPSFIIITPIFYYLLRAPTLKGREILDQVEGYKMYLETAESQDIALATGQNITEKIYEEHLPYAMALGIDSKWTEKFETSLNLTGRDMSTYHPRWYSGNRSWHNSSSFLSTVGTGVTSAIASASTPPGSSSGRGGGGSSGGGGGGGGGGGW